MPFSIRPHRRFPLQRFITSYGLGNGWVWGLVLLVLVTSGCTEWTIHPVRGHRSRRPVSGRVPWMLSQAGRPIPK